MGNKVKINLLSFTVLMVFALVLPAETEIDESSYAYRFDASLQQTPDSISRKSQWSYDAKFGAFIHFGVYSVLEGAYQGKVPRPRYSEWIEADAKMSTADYREVARGFNPVDFDADEWVSIFKDNGMKYVVITSKHHDGFALFDSAVSDFNMVDATPFRRDIIKELSEQRFKPDMDTYIREKSLPQIEELMKNYEIDLVWFDTPIEMTFEWAKLFSDVVRKYRPRLINSRLIQRGRFKIEQKNLALFDYISVGDKEVPTEPLPLYFESPDSVSTSYGYKTYGRHDYHSEQEMIQRLVHTVCAGGNYCNYSGSITSDLLSEVHR